jgi:hypothetical protein
MTSTRLNWNQRQSPTELDDAPAKPTYQFDLRRGAGHGFGVFLNPTAECKTQRKLRMTPFPSRTNILQFAAVLLLCAALSHAQTQALPPITPIEAVHLAEGKVPRLATSVVRNGVDGGTPVYIVVGMVK